MTTIAAEDAEAYLSDESNLEQSYIREERKILVHKALAKLPADYRSVLWLVYFEEFTPKEAGVILKKSSRQMKNLLYRAKQSLRLELEKEGFTYEEFE